MAKIRTGAVVGQISGSIAGTTFSRNRGGTYIRNRSIPSLATSDAAMNAKNRLALVSQRFQALTQAQRDAWTAFARQNTVTDVLGEQISLSGHGMHNRINARLEQAGDALLDDPPTLPPPDGLEDLSLEADIGDGDFQITFAPDADENQRVWVWTAVVSSAGVNYVQNLLKLTTVSDADADSPLDIESDTADRWGTLQVDQTVHVMAQLMDTRTGLVSGLRRTRATIIESTP